jgi:hypothetical protein
MPRKKPPCARPRKTRTTAGDEGDAFGDEEGVTEVDTSEKDDVATIEGGVVEGENEEAEQDAEAKTPLPITAVAARGADAGRAAARPRKPTNCAPSAWRCAAATRSRT